MTRSHPPAPSLSRLAALALVGVVGCGGGSDPGSVHMAGTPGAAESGRGIAPRQAMAAGLEATPTARKHKIELGPDRTLVLERAATGTWTLADSGTVHELVRTGDDLEVRTKGTTTAKGRLKGDKLELARGDGSPLVSVGFKPDKVKLQLPGGALWELKHKEDKIKVTRGEAEIGKVKHYPDTGKLKVKDASDVEVAALKDWPGLAGAPGVFLIERAGEIDAAGRAALLLVLAALDR